MLRSLADILRTIGYYLFTTVQRLYVSVQTLFVEEKKLASIQQMTVQQASKYLLDKLITLLLYLFVFLIFVSMAITFARYSQRSSNIESLKSETVVTKNLISYKALSFLSSAHTIKNNINKIIDGNGEQLDQEELFKASLFGKIIGHNYLEVTSSLLLMHDSTKLRISNDDYKTEYIFQVLYPSIRERMELHDYANAAYRAQRLVNYYNINPVVFSDRNRELMYARKVISNASDHYLYDSKSIMKLVDDINWYDDFQFKSKFRSSGSRPQDDILLPILEMESVPSDNGQRETESALNNYITSNSPNHREIVLYSLYDIKENSLNPIDKVKLWESYIAEYPNNKYTAEAYFNQLLALFSLQLKTLLNDEEKYHEIANRFYGIADKYKAQYKKSYLIDDAMYYAIIFSGLDRNENIVSYLKVLCSKGVDDKLIQLRLDSLFKTDNFNYTKFIYEVVNSPANMTFGEFENYTRLDPKYLRQLKRELYRLEGKKYRRSTLTEIIINIATHNLGGVNG